MLVHWIWLATLQGISLRQKLQLLEHFSDPEELYYAEDSDKSFPEVAAVLENKDLTYARQIIKQCADLHIRIVTLQDAAYPNRLKNIHNPPLLLYYKGILPDFDAQPAIGVVGTRKASPYGKTNALDMSRELACCGALVISGGAAGIDTEALKGALVSGMPTVAVFGCGVDVAFPSSNRNLFRQIEENGCLISEYPPGTTPLPWQFPERNRIISGLSNGVLVVEAPEKSGALITAREAMEQGRDVFVIPGNINISTCAGSNALLREGATAVFSAEDMLRDYAPQYPGFAQRQYAPKAPEPVWKEQTQQVLKAPADKINIDNWQSSAYSDQSNSGLDALSQKILQNLGGTPEPVDAVIARIEEPAAEVLSALTRLALMGLVINHPGRLVSAKRK